MLENVNLKDVEGKFYDDLLVFDAGILVTKTKGQLIGMVQGLQLLYLSRMDTIRKLEKLIVEYHIDTKECDKKWKG